MFIFSRYLGYSRYIYTYFFNNNFWLVVIFVLSLTLRIMGTYPGYYITHPDEPTITESVKKISLGLNFEPQAYYYGSLLSAIYSIPTILLLVPYVSFLFIINRYSFIVTLFPTILNNPKNLDKLSETFNAFVVSGSFFEYWVRAETAILSSFTVVIAYHLGRKLFNHYIGLVVAFYIAINYRHVLSSNLSLADAPAAFFVLLSVYLSSKCLNNSSWKTYIQSGIGLGLIFSVKYFIYTAPTFLLCHILSSWKNNHKLKFRNRMTAIFTTSKPIISILISFIVFSLINIFIFLKPEDALSQMQYNTTKYHLTASFEKFLNFSNIQYYPLYYLYKFAFGEVLTVVMLLGLIYSLLRYFKNSLVLLSSIIPFLYVFLIISETTETRFYSSIIPLVLFFPAVFTVDLAKKITQLTKIVNFKINFPLILSLLLFIIGLQSFQLSLLSSYHFSSPHNSDILQRWVLDEMPDGSNYVYFWGTPTPPGYKKINSTFITVDENNYPSMKDLYLNNTDYVVVGSDPGNVINGLLWINNNDVVKKAIFDDSFIWKYINDSYASLVTQELAIYRIAEFTKPWPVLDPSFFVVQYPKFWNTDRGDKIIEYNFDSTSGSDDWHTTSQDISPYYHLEYTSHSGYKNTGSILIQPSMDGLRHIPFIIFESKSFQVEPLRWYILSGWAKRGINNKYLDFKNGFLRLNFYDKNNSLLKSYVSQQLEFTKDAQHLDAAGFAPINADHGKITIQFNRLYNENYIFDNLGVYAARDQINFDKSQYPFFDQKLSKSFIWLPHL